MPVWRIQTLRSDEGQLETGGTRRRQIRRLGGIGGLIGVFMVVALTAVALTAHWIWPYDPLEVNVRNRLQPPGGIHFLGTDELGRDIFSRILAGTRPSLISATVVLGLSLTVGTVLGSVSGYYGGWVDAVIMRLTDIFLAFPALLLAMILASALGSGLVNAWFAMAAAWWPGFARLIRGQFLSLRELSYVEAARAIGASDLRIIFRHILKNASSPLMVKTTVDVGYVILFTASLSFIGLGAQPPTPEWGAMVTEGRRYLLSQWWLATFPGMAIFLAVLSFTLLGDALRDVFDPKL
jgi:peptide/nickel transport system permease protein